MTEHGFKERAVTDQHGVEHHRCKCGMVYPADAGRCPKDPVTDLEEAFKWHCPDCGHSNEWRHDTCRQCGYAIEDAENNLPEVRENDE